MEERERGGETWPPAIVKLNKRCQLLPRPRLEQAEERGIERDSWTESERGRERETQFPCRTQHEATSSSCCCCCCQLTTLPPGLRSSSFLRSLWSLVSRLQLHLRSGTEPQPAAACHVKSVDTHTHTCTHTPSGVEWGLVAFAFAIAIVNCECECECDCE